MARRMMARCSPARMSSRFSPSDSRSRSSAPANTVQVELMRTGALRLHRQRAQLVQAQVHLVGDVAQVAPAAGGAAVVHLEGGDDAARRRPGWPWCPGRRCRARCACRGTARARRRPWQRISERIGVLGEGQALRARSRCRRRPPPRWARCPRRRSRRGAARAPSGVSVADDPGARPCAAWAAKSSGARLGSRRRGWRLSKSPTRSLEARAAAGALTCSAARRYAAPARSRKKSLAAPLAAEEELGCLGLHRPRGWPTTASRIARRRAAHAAASSTTFDARSQRGELRRGTAAARKAARSASSSARASSAPGAGQARAARPRAGRSGREVSASSSATVARDVVVAAAVGDAAAERSRPASSSTTALVVVEPRSMPTQTLHAAPPRALPRFDHLAVALQAVLDVGRPRSSAGRPGRSR